MDYMGSSKDPDLTIAKSLTNQTQKCLQRCDLQTETMMTTTSQFPNRETFPYRKEICYVLQKIAKICNDSIQRSVFEPSLKYGVTCYDILVSISRTTFFHVKRFKKLDRFIIKKDIQSNRLPLGLAKYVRYIRARFNIDIVNWDNYFQSVVFIKNVNSL